MRNGKTDKTIATVSLVILITFLGYLLYIFIPVWLFSVSNSNGFAKVVSLTEKEVEYSYYHEYQKKEIKLEREIREVSYYQKIGKSDVLKIKYSRYLPSSVIFVGIDEYMPIPLTLIVLFLTLFSIRLNIMVLVGKIQLKTLLGVKD